MKRNNGYDHQYEGAISESLWALLKQASVKEMEGDDYCQGYELEIKGKLVYLSINYRNDYSSVMEITGISDLLRSAEGVTHISGTQHEQIKEMMKGKVEA